MSAKVTGTLFLLIALAGCGGGGGNQSDAVAPSGASRELSPSEVAAAWDEAADRAGEIITSYREKEKKVEKLPLHAQDGAWLDLLRKQDADILAVLAELPPLTIKSQDPDRFSVDEVGRVKDFSARTMPSRSFYITIPVSVTARASI